MSNIYQILMNTALNHPENIALTFKGHDVTYAKLKEATDRLAGGLKKMGFGSEDRMALMLPNTPHFSMAFFALLKLGTSIVPVSTLYKPEEIHHQLEDSEVKGIIYWEGFRDHVLQAVHGLERCEKLIVLGDKAKPGEIRFTYLMETSEPLDETAELDDDKTALIVYTSGITGYPRGAELTHRNIISNIESIYGFLKVMAEDCVVGTVPLYHPLGHTLVMGVFTRAAAHVVLLSRIDIAGVLETIVEEKATYFVGVPSIFREMLKIEDVKPPDFSFLKFCLSSGDALSQETMSEFEARFSVTILEGYGLTEASALVSCNSPTMERRVGSIGLPLPGIELRIVDEKDEDVKPGQVGEIIVQGPNIMKGYLNRQEATKEALKDGWLRTGDLARLDENGHGFIVVRKKTVIIKSGFSVYPREVERFLFGYPKIKEAVVVGVSDDIYGEEIHAAIVLKEGETATQDEIIDYSKERMAAYKCPRLIHFYDALPKGATGRILRDKVKHMITET